MANVFRGMGERNVIFGLALQDAAIAQQAVELPDQLGIAAQGAAVIADGLGGEYRIEERRLARDLRGDPFAPQQSASVPINSRPVAKRRS